MRNVLLAICLSALPAMATDVYTFSVSAAETVSGSVGQGVLTGWGYTIQNESTSDWLVTTSLSAGAFLHATPQLIFDFPDLAPGESKTILYNPVEATGLYQILWDQNAPAGATNSGAFTLSAQWWSGDPLARGTLLTAAPDSSQGYSVTLTPEPQTASVMALSFMVLGIARICRRR